MNQHFADIIMHPTRQRLVQYLLVHQRGTVSDMARELSDIPRPTLYRHIKVLLQANCLQIVEQTPVRGAVEKTYALVAQPLGDASEEDVELLIQGALLSVMGSFSRYFASGNAQPEKDMLSLSSSTLMLSDAEFSHMIGEIGQVYRQYLDNKPQEGRRPRHLVWISAPVAPHQKGD